MKTKFEIELTKKQQIENGLFYVEFASIVDPFDDYAKKIDQINETQLDDPVYLENVRIELFDLLDEMCGSEFTNQFEK